jgi:hypothetical protein
MIISFSVRTNSGRLRFSPFFLGFSFTGLTHFRSRFSEATSPRFGGHGAAHCDYAVIGMTIPLLGQGHFFAFAFGPGFAFTFGFGGFTASFSDFPARKTGTFFSGMSISIVGF